MYVNNSIVKNAMKSGAKVSTSALALGGLAAQAASIKLTATDAVNAWLASVGLVLPPVPKAVTLKDAKTGKVLKDADGKARRTKVNKAHAAIEWKVRGEVLGSIKRDAEGKVSIKLSPRAQSSLINDVTLGIIDYVSRDAGRDLSACYMHEAHKQPQFKADTETMKAIVGEQAGREVKDGVKARIQRIRVAYGRARGMLASNGIKIDLPMQTAKGKNGGRKAKAKDSADYRLFNAMKVDALYAHLTQHGVSASVIERLARYTLEKRAA